MLSHPLPHPLLVCDTWSWSLPCNSVLLWTFRFLVFSIRRAPPWGQFVPAHPPSPPGGKTNLMFNFMPCWLTEYIPEFNFCTFFCAYHPGFLVPQDTSNYLEKQEIQKVRLALIYKTIRHFQEKRMMSSNQITLVLCNFKLVSNHSFRGPRLYSICRLGTLVCWVCTYIHNKVKISVCGKYTDWVLMCMGIFWGPESFLSVFTYIVRGLIK